MTKRAKQREDFGNRGTLKKKEEHKSVKERRKNKQNCLNLVQGAKKRKKQKFGG